jgi:hypothetical protein
MVQPPGQSYLRDIIIKRRGEGGVESGEWRGGREATTRRGGREGGGENERPGTSLQVKLNAEYEVLGGYLVDRAPTGRTPRLNHVTASEEPPPPLSGFQPTASSLQPPASDVPLPATNATAHRSPDVHPHSLPPDHI